MAPFESPPSPGTYAENPKSHFTPLQGSQNTTPSANHKFTPPPRLKVLKLLIFQRTVLYPTPENESYSAVSYILLNLISTEKERQTCRIKNILFPV